jgi:hypothetical protein
MDEESSSEQDPVETQELKAALKSLKFVQSSFVKKVDTGFALPAWQVFLGNDSRKALAYQAFDTHTVYVKTKCADDGTCPYGYGIEDIGSMGRSFLRIHEAYIRLEKDKGLDEVTAETYTRNKIARLVSNPEFEKMMIASVRSSAEFTNASAQSNLYHLWQDLDISVKSSGSKNDMKNELGLFLNILSQTGFACSSSLSSEKEFLSHYSKLSEKIWQVSDGNELQDLIHSGIPETFAGLCSMTTPDSEFSRNPDPKNPDPKNPEFFTPGSDYEHIHQSVGGNLHVLVVPVDSRCNGIPMNVLVFAVKSHVVLTSISAKTYQDLSIPLDFKKLTPGTLFTINVATQCKYPTTFLMYAGGDDNGYTLLATPSSSETGYGVFPGGSSFGTMTFKNEGN